MLTSHHVLLDDLTQLIEANQSLTLELPVDTGLFEVAPDMLRSIGSQLTRAGKLLGTIATRFDEGEKGWCDPEILAEDETDFLRQIAAGISTTLAAREVADLAFLGRADLRGVCEELEVAIRQENFWQVASAADAALSRIGRALIPIESALRQFEDLPPKRRRWDNIQDSLDIRRQYGLLWHGVHAFDPRQAGFEKALLNARQRISALRRNPIYPFLRINDRLSIRQVQKRIRAWVEAPVEERREDGTQLWDELVSCCRLLMQINHRTELREYDRMLVESSYEELSQNHGSGEILPKQALYLLQSLLGRDESLDRILLHPEVHRVEDCLGTLARLRNELQPDLDPRIRASEPGLPRNGEVPATLVRPSGEPVPTIGLPPLGRP